VCLCWYTNAFNIRANWCVQIDLRLSIILTQLRNTQRLRPGNPQSSNKKTFIVFRAPASSCITTSPSYTLHGISIQHTHQRSSTLTSPSFENSLNFSRRWPRLVSRPYEDSCRDVPTIEALIQRHQPRAG
jgi:hypothetical protein